MNTKYSRQDKEDFIQLLASMDFRINAASDKFRETHKGFSKVNYYNWKKNDPEFVESHHLAMQELVEEAEHAHRLLRKGIGQYHPETGEIIAWIEKPDRQACENFLVRMERKSWDKAINQAQEIKIEIPVPKFLKRPVNEIQGKD